jgi:CMP-N-acetylneuraminic acid synthetase
MNKNLAQISGRNLVQRTIDVALELFSTNQIYITSDSREVIELASSNEINVHYRDEFAASDQAVASDVLCNFIDSGMLLPKTKQSHSLIYLQPTSPFRKSQHIQECVALHEQNENRPVISVRSSPIRLQKLLEKDDRGLLLPLFSEKSATGNAQSMQRVFYLPNGAVYIFKIRDFIERGAFPVDCSIPYEMNDLASVDIDDYSDLELARELAEKLGW